MEFIKIILSSCGVLGAAFSGNPFKLTYVESKPIQIECQGVSGQRHSLNCLFSEQAPNEKDFKTRKKAFKFSVVEGGGLVLADSKENEILQIKSGKVVYHQRLLNDSASLEKVCSGNITEKK